MEKVQPKTICNAFDEQLDISESVYKVPFYKKRRDRIA